METYIAFLRGVNVGGHRKIKMDDLKQVLVSMGLDNISTYIQSGNIIFDTQSADRQTLPGLISEKIKDAYAYEVPVIIRSPDELINALDRFPFQEKEGWKGYISFLAQQPDEEIKKQWISSSSEIEKFAAEGNHLFSLVNKVAKEKPQFSNSFVEKITNKPATTRNLRTVRKILELC